MKKNKNNVGILWLWKINSRDFNALVNHYKAPVVLKKLEFITHIYIQYMAAKMAMLEAKKPMRWSFHRPDTNNPILSYMLYLLWKNRVCEHRNKLSISQYYDLNRVFLSFHSKQISSNWLKKLLRFHSQRQINQLLL